MQVHLSKADVEKDFKRYINEYCEQYILTHKVNPMDVCQIMVEEFKDDFSDGFVRKCIDKKFKIKFRSRNAELKGENKVTKLKRKMGEMEKELLGLTFETISYSKRDL